MKGNEKIRQLERDLETIDNTLKIMARYNIVDALFTQTLLDTKGCIKRELSEETQKYK
jgi:hypothetical protein